MTSGRAALSWGFGLSLALHAAWLGSAPEPRPYVKRAPPAQSVELALIQLPARKKEPVGASNGAPVAQPSAADTQPAPPPEPVAPQTRSLPPAARAQGVASAKAAVARRAPRHSPSSVAEEPASVAPPLPAAEGTGRDLSALERTLKRIAATPTLTPDQRRKAMLVVLRTWEDPSRNESADQLIDALLRELRPGQDR